MVYRTSVLPALLQLLATLRVGAVVPALAQPAPTITWQSAAQYRQLAHKPAKGTLLLDDAGIEFRSPGFSQRWPYGEIKTFDLSGTRELVITDYENRRWHEPGERRFRFVLAQAMPPAVAAQFTANVGRPVINGDPFPKADAIAELPAHRRERFGGSNGVLRFRDDGIDYAASDGRDSRSWRWSDIQTIANPDAWEFRVTAYREVVEFDLKRPLPPALFDRLWNSLYAQDLNVGPPDGGHHQ